MKKLPYHAHLEVFDNDRTTKVIELELGSYASMRQLEDMRVQLQKCNPQYSVVLIVRCDDFEHE